MTMVGGFDVHRKQITFDYVDTDTGLVRCGEIRPATRTTLRRWLGEHCPAGDAEMAVEGCTGWRYVVEELAAAGATAHLADPAETAGLRGPNKRAKTDRADARLLRTLLLGGRLPESWIPPAHVREVRTLGRLYCALMEERRAWRQRIHAQLFHQGCPPIAALLTAAGGEALATAELSPTGRQYVDTFREATHGQMVDSVTEAVGKTETVNLAMAIVGAGRNVNILGAGQKFQVGIPFRAAVHGVTVRANMVTEIARYWPDVLPVLVAGRIHPERVFTDRIGLSDGLRGYERVMCREPGVLKVLMQPV
jgi:hypothetical protein